MKFENVSLCEVCESKNYKEFLSVPDRNYLTGTFHYVRCTNCRLVWLTPRPSMASLHQYYPNVYPAYRGLKKATTLQKMTRWCIKNISLAGHLLIRDQLFFWRPKGRILDVGTGNGLYLSVLAEWGWQTYGIELDKAAVKRAKSFGLKNMFQGTLESSKFKSGFFDVVRYSHVLEHVPSPKRELKKVFKLLKKGGSVVISVPNIESIFFKFFKSYWYPLEPPRHFFQFSDKTLSLLLKRVGFKNVRVTYIQSPHPIYWSFRYMLGHHHVENKLGVLSFPLGALVSGISLLRRSDIIEVTAQKL